METRSCKNKKEEYFDEIFECFYDDLPRDEKMIVDCLQAIDAVRATSNSLYGSGVIEDSLQDLLSRDVYKAEEIVEIETVFSLSVNGWFKRG